MAADILRAARARAGELLLPAGAVVFALALGMAAYRAATIQERYAAEACLATWADLGAPAYDPDLGCMVTLPDGRRVPASAIRVAAPGAPR